MITPSFSPTATERVLPKLALDFTTAILDPRVTFTRSGNTATYIPSSGVITAINADLPRFDYNPTTLVCQGLLIEEARTNLLLNSLINGTSLSTQSVTTTATAYTISFYGTGNIVLSGTSTGTITGTGVYPSRKTYTFTPTSGILTLTVSGTVQYAQLEVGSFATSFIPTDGTSKTRNADVATMTGTNFSSWYVSGGGSLTVQAAMVGGVPSSSQRIVSLSGSNVDTDDISIYWGTTQGYPLGSVRTANSQQYAGGPVVTIGSQQTFNAAFRWATNIAQEATNGSIATVDNSVNLPTVVSMGFGQPAVFQGTANVWIKKVAYYPQTLTANETQAFSK